MRLPACLPVALSFGLLVHSALAQDDAEIAKLTALLGGTDVTMRGKAGDMVAGM